MNAASLKRPIRHRRGMMLVECLIYLAISSILVSLGIALYLRCLDSATNFGRNADDIAGALSVGERWRADLRDATAMPQFLGVDSTEFIIPQAKGNVIYRFANGMIWRRQASDAGWAHLLDRVASATWNSESRTHVTAWHLDIEMKTRKPHVRVRPLFSFIGVAGRADRP
ncbi:hypothetical protein GC207_15440 [bacterium]|nr:hypothetical protein [bacterium]